MSVRTGDAGVALQRTPAGTRTAETIRVDQLQWLPCVAVVLLSLVLNTWSLSVAGYGNTYYAAAVRSMTMSWRNFLFGSFDPGGLITVDKPPVFLWIDALSARTFGYSTWSLLLPSSIAGAASVGLLWLIVRRYFGLFAATTAGLALALSPVSVAVDRLNLPEPFLILALVAAAGAIMRSLESRHWWAWTVGAGVLVGVAFNTKMLAAWIPGPAFAAAVVFGSTTLTRATVRTLLLRLALLGLVMFVVSSSWMLVVDAWPQSDRPYVGGSTNNTVFDLVIGYNGLDRVAGYGGGPGPGSVSGPGGVFGGVPGPLRLFDDANGGQIGWLLPFAIGSGLVALWSWQTDPTRRACVLLFLGWIALYGATFSFAQGTFHAFYTSAMAPAVAALVGIGAAGLSHALRRDWRWLWVVVTLVGVTAWTQLQISDRTPDFYGWVGPFTGIASVAGVVSVVILTLRRGPVAGGIALSVAGLLLLPAAWSFSAASNASLNATVPQAGPQRGEAGDTFGSLAFDEGTAQLAPWLKSHADGSATWQLVVPNSQDGARLIAQYGLSVMSLGGFLGGDDPVSVARFADLASAGSVRFVLLDQPAWWGIGGLGSFVGVAPGDMSEADTVLSAVASACAPVRTSSLPAMYRDVLYDCAGRAAAIRSAEY